LQIPQLEFKRVALLRLVVVLWLLRLVVAVVAEPKPEEAEEAKRYSRSEKVKLIEKFK